MTHDTIDHAAAIHAMMTRIKARAPDITKNMEYRLEIEKSCFAIQQYTKDLAAENAALRAQLADERARSERLARAAMYAAQFIETVPQLNGVTQIAAYNQFEETWMTTLTAADMTFAHGVVGLPEPHGDLPADGEGEQA